MLPAVKVNMCMINVAYLGWACWFFRSLWNNALISLLVKFVYPLKIPHHSINSFTLVTETNVGTKNH